MLTHFLAEEEKEKTSWFVCLSLNNTIASFRRGQNNLKVKNIYNHTNTFLSLSLVQRGFSGLIY